MKSSKHLGLARALQFLTDNSLELAMLVTDRHSQIAKYIAEKSQRLHIFMIYGTCLKICGLITYYSIYINVYYCKITCMVAIKKKTSHLAKTKECSAIGEWIKSITNYLYWSTATASDEDDFIRRWKPLMDHICNKHDDCYYDPLDKHKERRKNGLF